MMQRQQMTLVTRVFSWTVFPVLMTIAIAGTLWSMRWRQVVAEFDGTLPPATA